MRSKGEVENWNPTLEKARHTKYKTAKRTTNLQPACMYVPINNYQYQQHKNKYHTSNVDLPCYQRDLTNPI